MARDDLDSSRSYGVVNDGGPTRFEQDHRHFDQQGPNEAASLLRSRSDELEDRVDWNIDAATQIAFIERQYELCCEREAAPSKKCDDCPFGDDWFI